MPQPKTITSANADFLLTVPGLFPVPFKVQGFASDAAFLFDTVDSAEVVVGVDGNMSAGFTPFATPQQITLMPDSPSIQLFDDVLAAMKLAKEMFFFYGSIALPGVRKSYVMTKGAMRRVTQAPPAGKVLQPQAYEIVWQDIQQTPLVQV